MDALATLMAYHNSALIISLKTLADCLVANGSLKPGQFEAAIQATINMEGAERGRPDYQFLESVLKVFENKEAALH